ncbi:M15 family metallopeptidase [Actinoplanes sp. NPDC051851]|uniref:M15 family metallopeptidase n=1 Tax=Actinoplanes sp. NPDC051851 TaxID=3154753 RepID=UPI0034438A2C
MKRVAIALGCALLSLAPLPANPSSAAPRSGDAVLTPTASRSGDAVLTPTASRSGDAVLTPTASRSGDAVRTSAAAGSGDAALTNAAAPPSPSPDSSPYSVTSIRPDGHVVRPGDTVRTVARLYRLRAADLRRWNRIGRHAALRPDGVLSLRTPATPLPRWASRIEPVTPADVTPTAPAPAGTAPATATPATPAGVASAAATPVGPAATGPAPKCPVTAADLRRVWVKYMDFEGAGRDGWLIVNRSIARSTQKAFATLYRRRFPIMVMQPLDVNRPGLTDRSIVTGGYECRTVAGTTHWSQHAYGLAIDVNPRQNPMIRGTYLDPPGSDPWIPRAPYRTGMIHDGGAETAFTRNGFFWGGRWHTLKDYMHFSPNDR